ncbi:MAG: response regulator transcription factor [Burkholderiales bacterium]
MNEERAPVTVLLVDDHAVVREGYRRLLERAGDLRVVGEAATAADGYRCAVQAVPDVVVMDISLPDVSGIEALRRLRARLPEARVLMFSIHDEPVFARRAFAAGAAGYVTKASAPDVLVDAVRTVARGEPFLGPDVARALALSGVLGEADDLAGLSPREFEIARLLAQGCTVREVADRLSLSAKTVANHQSQIRQKLGARSAVEFIRIATERGLLGRDAPPSADRNPPG